MASSAKIELNGITHTITVNEGQNLLETMIEENIDPPFSCRNGICGTCKAKLVNGEVAMKKHPALEETDIANGMILCCQAVAKSPELDIVYE